MKRVLLATIFLLCSTFILIPSLAEASSFLPVCDANNPASNTSVCQDVNAQTGSSGNLVIRLIDDAINVLSVLVGAAAIIIIIISGIRLITSGGDSNAVSGAKMGILAAIIGLVVVALAQTIVIFVLDNIK